MESILGANKQKDYFGYCTYSKGSSKHILICSPVTYQALIVKLKDPDPDPNPGVINNVLATIGELAQVRILQVPLCCPCQLLSFWPC